MAATETAASDGSVIAHWLTTATGATSAITVRGSKLVDLALQLVGTGTIAVEIEMRTKTTATINDPAWEILESHTADVVKTYQIAGARRMRLNCSAHGGSGTITAELTAGNRTS